MTLSDTCQRRKRGVRSGYYWDTIRRHPDVQREDPHAALLPDRRSVACVQDSRASIQDLSAGDRAMLWLTMSGWDARWISSYLKCKICLKKLQTQRMAVGDKCVTQCLYYHMVEWKNEELREIWPTVNKIMIEMIIVLNFFILYIY